MDDEKLKVIIGRIKKISESIMILTSNKEDLCHIYALALHLDSLVFSVDFELKERKRG